MSHNSGSRRHGEFLYVSTLNSQTQLITPKNIGKDISATLDDKHTKHERKMGIKKRLLNISLRFLNNILCLFVL
jgi:hypothetical protein